MTDSERRRILAEARANLADHEPTTDVKSAPWRGIVDSEPVERWKAEGLAADRARARAKRETQREEQEHLARQAEQPAIDWAAIDRRIEQLVAQRIKALIPELFAGIGLVSEDIEAAIGRLFDQTDARLASLEQLLNKRAGRSVPIDEQAPLRRVN